MKKLAISILFILLFIIILAVLLFGCTEEKIANPSGKIANPSNDYFPMHVGNSWTFAYNVGDQEKEENFSIVESRRIGNNDYFVFDKRPTFILGIPEKDDIKIAVVRKNEQGDILLRFYQEELLIYKFSDTVGTVNIAHAASHPRFEDGIDFYSILESVQDTVVTQAGTFEDCYRFLILIG